LKNPQVTRILHHPLPCDATHMHTLRKLAREIHRRSVWQVLSVYVALSWGVLLLVEALSNALGLPLWTPDMALALLIIGLPVTLATAVVQEGIPWLRIEDEIDPNELVGRTPAEVHVVPESHPLHRASLFTWRNAILGGVMAGALLVTSVAAYLAMWALGIGPVGSLLAQGLIHPDDRVLVAVVEPGASGGVAETAAQALESHLRRSTLVRVVGVGELERDGSPDVPGAEYVREVATRGGIELVIFIQVTPTNDGYVVSGRIISADGQSLAWYREVAAGSDDVRAAAELVSVRIRAKMGEALRAIGTQ
jgi:hypothetical protein